MALGYRFRGETVGGVNVGGARVYSAGPAANPYDPGLYAERNPEAWPSTTLLSGLDSAAVDTSIFYLLDELPYDAAGDPLDGQPHKEPNNSTTSNYRRSQIVQTADGWRFDMAEVEGDWAGGSICTAPFGHWWNGAPNFYWPPKLLLRPPFKVEGLVTLAEIQPPASGTASSGINQSFWLNTNGGHPGSRTGVDIQLEIDLVEISYYGWFRPFASVHVKPNAALTAPLSKHTTTTGRTPPTIHAQAEVLLGPVDPVTAEDYRGYSVSIWYESDLILTWNVYDDVIAKVDVGTETYRQNLGDDVADLFRSETLVHALIANFARRPHGWNPQAAIAGDLAYVPASGYVHWMRAAY